MEFSEANMHTQKTILIVSYNSHKENYITVTGKMTNYKASNHITNKMLLRKNAVGTQKLSPLL